MISELAYWTKFYLHMQTQCRAEVYVDNPIALKYLRFPLRPLPPNAPVSFWPLNCLLS